MGQAKARGTREERIKAAHEASVAAQLRAEQNDRAYQRMRDANARQQIGYTSADIHHGPFGRVVMLKQSPMRERVEQQRRVAIYDRPRPRMGAVLAAALMSGLAALPSTVPVADYHDRFDRRRHDWKKHR